MVVNALYYGSPASPAPATVAGESAPAPVSSASPSLASGSLLDDDTLAALLVDIYDRHFNPTHEVHPGLYGSIRSILREGVSSGLAAASGSTPTPTLRDALLHSADVFSAFKVHRAQNDMARLLLDEHGSLRSFSDWKQLVAPIASHQCGAWLRTEYDTAVLRAHQAADWQRFRDQKDILPNLRWMPSTSATPGADHQPFWGTVLPVDDPFWQQHRPGDRWNCKCSLEPTDDPATSRPQSPAPDAAPQPGLDSNPADGSLFSSSHPYIANAYPGAAEAVQRVVKKKFVFDTKAEIVPPEVEDYKSFLDGGVMISPYHGEDEMIENIRIASFIHNKLKKIVYLLPRLDPQNAHDSELRSRLLPSSVPEGKNSDFLIGGLLFEGKSMLEIKTTNYKQAIHNRIKKGKKQAQNIILEIPTFISRKIISQAINGALMQSPKEHIIIVKHGKKCYIYKKKRGLTPAV